MIRTATLDDVQQIVAMGQRFRRNIYADLMRENPTQMAALGTRLIEGANSCVFVDDRDGALVGMLGMFLFDHPFSGDRIAGEVFWWMEPEHRGAGLRLFVRAQRWAKERGAQFFQLVAPSPQVAQMYRRLNFTEVETAFQRAL